MNMDRSGEISFTIRIVLMNNHSETGDKSRGRNAYAPGHHLFGDGNRVFAKENETDFSQGTKGDYRSGH